MEGNFNQAPQQELPKMDINRAAELLGLGEGATAQQIIYAYESIIDGDKKTSEWAPERSTLDERDIPAQLDWFVEDLKQNQADDFLESIGFDMTKPETSEKIPSMATIAESLQNLGFNVTEKDEALMREAIQELVEKGDDGIHSLPVGTERALGL